MSTRFLREATMMIFAWLGSSVVLLTQAQGTNEEAKWSQLPGYQLFTNSPNLRGGDRPSDFDWLTLMTNQFTNLVVLDQAYVWAPPDDREFIIQLGFDRSQTFTAGTNGLLTLVELLLRRDSATNQGDLVFDIRATSNGVPLEASTPALFAATIPAAVVSNYAFLTVDLSAVGVRVTNGQVLALTLRTPGLPNAQYRWRGAGSNVYSRGVLYTRGAFPATWTNVNGLLDASFRTFVVPDAAVPQPNWVIADDFILEQNRPITTVRWWGSYLNGTTNGFEDGFVLSFFAWGNGNIQPGAAVGSYVVPTGAVRSFNTGYLGGDNSAIYEYEVDLKDTCLLQADTNFARPAAFVVPSNVPLPPTGPIPWLAITAEVGHRITPQTNSDGVITNWLEQTTGKRATNHFWGWHTSPITNCIAPPAGLLGWWAGDANTQDYAGSAPGVAVNGISYAAGKVGPAFSFNGTSTFLRMGDMLDPGAGSFTVDAWFRRTGTPSDFTIVRKGDTGSSQPPDIGYGIGGTSTTLSFTVRAGGAQIAANTPLPSLNQWHHVAGVLDRAAGQVRLFLDGALAAQQSFASLGAIDTEIYFAVGAFDRGPRDSVLAFFPGQIDEVEYFNRALGSNEIAALFNSGSAGKCKPGGSFGIANLSPSAMNHVFMQGTNWLYPEGAWMPNDYLQLELDQAFELLTQCVTISCPSNLTVWTCSTSAPVFFTAAAADACDTNVTITCTPASGSSFPVGTNTVTCVASDSRGHSNSCSFTVTVVRDTTAPVIACPTNQTVLTTGLGAVVSYTATATDNFDTNVPVQCMPPSGSIFPIGTTTVNCDATDDCGNVAHCSFTVRVDRTGGDVVTVTVTNTTGQAASDLHITFSGAGGNLEVTPLSVVAPGCPVPTVPSNGMVTNTAVIDWGSPCVAPGALVRLTVRTTNGPLAVVDAFWTGAGGQNLGSALVTLRHGTLLIFEPSDELQPVPETYGDRVISSPDANGDVYGAGSGFTPNVVVSYGPAGSSVLEAPFDYGDLSGVAYQEDGDFGVLEVTLTADPGVQVILDSFDLAGLGWDYLIDAVQVLDETETELFGQTEVIIAGDNSQHTHFDFGPAGLMSRVLLIRVDVHQLGNTESHRAGIDNIQFSQFPEPTAPCPPPPTLTIEQSGASVLISWTGDGYCLQTASALGAPGAAPVWTTIPGASPVTLPIESGVRFFRLVCPCP